MKARAVRIDTAVETTGMVSSQPQVRRHSSPPVGESIAALQVRIQVQRDEKARLARVEQIKSQVDTGTYQLDNQATIYGLLGSPLDWSFVCMSAPDID
ncbi:hypothetical protein KSC_048400 [Ktedonobacter sp. SOSP1-52]|nr:hypothetical protein KSC_048400 [Ktedonobacter sp. SOSP1-52]